MSFVLYYTKQEWNIFRSGKSHPLTNDLVSTSVNNLKDEMTHFLKYVLVDILSDFIVGFFFSFFLFFCLKKTFKQTFSSIPLKLKEAKPLFCNDLLTQRR